MDTLHQGVWAATLPKHGPQPLVPPNCRIYQGVPPDLASDLDQQHSTVSACLMVESSIQPCPTSGQSLRPCLVMLLYLQPCLIAEYKQQYYLGEHILWYYLKEVIEDPSLQHWLITDSNHWHHPVRKYSLWPHPVRGDCQPQLLVQLNTGCYNCKIFYVASCWTQRKNLYTKQKSKIKESNNHKRIISQRKTAKEEKK